MHVRFRAILLRFPDYYDRILKQIQENEDFECLCADYGECVELLETIIVESGRRSNLLAQYTELKNELELEVLKFLSR